MWTMERKVFSRHVPWVSPAKAGHNAMTMWPHFWQLTITPREWGPSIHSGFFACVLCCQWTMLPFCRGTRQQVLWESRIYFWNMNRSVISHRRQINIFKKKVSECIVLSSSKVIAIVLEYCRTSACVIKIFKTYRLYSKNELSIQMYVWRQKDWYKYYVPIFAEIYYVLIICMNYYMSYSVKQFWKLENHSISQF